MMKRKLSSDLIKMLSFRLKKYYEHQKALCMFLIHFSGPCRYSNMTPDFARTVPQICMTINIVVSYMYINLLHLISDFNQQWLSPESISSFANEVQGKEVPLQNWEGV